MFDKPRVRLLREQLQLTLNELGKELNLNFQLGRATFTSSNVKFALEAAVINGDGVVENSAVTAFNVFAPKFGLQPSDFGKEFYSQGKLFKIVGLMPRRPKYPILCESNGRRFKFSADQVKYFLKEHSNA